MLGLRIFLGIVAFFLIILMIPIYIKFTYNEETSLLLRYLFIKFKVLPQKEKTEKQLAKEKKKEEQKLAKSLKKKKNTLKTENQTTEVEEESNFKKFKNLLKEKGIDTFFSLLYEILKAIKNAAKGTLNNIVIKNMTLKVSVGNDTPYQTAIDYGKMCSAIFPASVFVVENIKTKAYNIQVIPDFENKSIKVNAVINIKVRPIIMVGIAIKLLYRIAKNIIKFIFKNKNNQE